jgi:3-deoxy-D-manno-octulosonate 8-phosphate phosphatase (KDO 8-P phosphatase)
MTRRRTSIIRRAKKIRVLLMDVDGVLTDGRIWLTWTVEGSAHEIKGFSAQDGVRLKLARAAGLRTGVITGRESQAMTRRAKETELEFVYQKQAVKLPAYEEILQESGAKEDEVCFIGDDLPDLPILKRVGLAVAVANAAPEAKAVAHYVTRKAGGHGAVSEVIELILKAQGKWQDAIRNARA